MIETDETADLEALQARKLADAKHALRAFEAAWESYEHGRDLHELHSKEHAAKTAAFAEDKKRYDAFIERMEARRKTAAELVRQRLRIDPHSESDLIQLLAAYLEPWAEIHSIERQAMLLPRKRATAIAFRPKAVPPQGLRRGLLDRFLDFVPRTNRFLYTYRVTYTGRFHVRDAVGCTEALAIFAATHAQAALAPFVPREEAPLFPPNWIPLPPEVFAVLVSRLLAARATEQGSIESNNAAESKDTLQQNVGLRGHIQRSLARDLIRVVNAELLPSLVDQIPVLSRNEAPPPVEPGSVPKEPEPPRLVPGTTRLWEELPWEAHLERLEVAEERSPAQHLLLGYEPQSATPVFIARPLLHAHAHVVGATQTGKTSAALIPLVTQLIRGSDESPAPGNLVGPPPPILIIDLKGDFALFNSARLEAKRRGQAFHHFTTHPEKDSHIFDVIGSLSSLIPYRGDLGAFFAQAFDIFHGPGYGHGFYSKVNRETTVTGLDIDFEESGGQPSLAGLGEAIKATGSRKSAETKEAQATIAPLVRPELLSRLEPPVGVDPSRVIHMPTAVENREVLYFWIPVLRSTAGLDVARLALYSFMHAVAERYYTRGERRSYAIVDEFQEVASFNIGRLLTFSAGAGLSLLMANQSVQNLKVGNTDIRDQVTANANLRLFFSVSSGDDIEELQKLSGEKTVWTIGRQRSRGRSRGTLESTTETDSFSDATGKNWGETWGKMWQRGSASGGNAQGGTWNNSEQKGGSQSENEGGSSEHTDSHSIARGTGKNQSWDWRVMFGRTETIRPGLDANEILDASLVDRACLVHSKRDAGKTLLGGRPRAIRCLYSMDAEEYGARRRTVWPPAPASPPLPAVTADAAPPPSPAPAEPAPSDPEKPLKEHPKRRERGVILQTFFDEHAPPPLTEQSS